MGKGDCLRPPIPEGSTYVSRFSLWGLGHYLAFEVVSFSVCIILRIHLNIFKVFDFNLLRTGLFWLSGYTKMYGSFLVAHFDCFFKKVLKKSAVVF